MGLTPLEGLIMGTRCGDLDPAIVFYLADKGYSVDQLNDMFNKKSGLLGISGASNDMRNLVELASGGNRRAQLAIDIFCYRIKKYIGTYTAVIGTLDALIFTGGIGENSPAIRAQVCTDLTQIGIEIDPARNQASQPKERLISTDSSRVRVYVIATNEEAAIAAETRRLLGLPGLAISATAVQVPVFYGSAAAVHVGLSRPLDAEAARQALRRAPAVKLIDRPGEGVYPMPMLAVNDDAVLVGRVRSDAALEHGLALFLAVDDLRKGGPTNLVQVALAMVERHRKG